MTTNILDKNAILAAYLRKSREDKDEDDTLRKHREQLQDYAERHGFDNVQWFEEVGSGESIEGRPVFASLLPRIEDGEFDGVLVIHIDRLSRGSQAEAGLIQEAFEESKTILLTLEKVYDFTNESDLMLSEFQGTISRNELRSIKRRLREGKKKMVQDGRPHSGNPPYGYYWDRNDMTVKIHEEKSKIYRLMIQWYLDDNLSGTMIADKLTEMNVPTPSGRGRWHGDYVTKLLIHDFHLGYVVYGRYKTKTKFVNGEKKYTILKNKDPKTMIVARGIHEPIKTEEEHAAILKRLETLRTYNTRERQARKNTYRLSGLVYCPHCGKCHGIGKTGTRKEHLRKCLKKSPTRTAACNGTKGVTEDIVVELIFDHLKQYKANLFSPNKERREESENSMNDIVEMHRQAVEKAKRRIERAKDMFKNELIEMKELKEDIAKEETTIRQAEDKISELKKSIGFLDKAEEKKRRENWSSEDVTRLLDGEEFEASEINDILRRLIERVAYAFDEQGKLSVRIQYR